MTVTLRELPNGLRAGSWGQDRPKGRSMASIAAVRAWVEKACGPSTLVMERIDNRTYVALRFGQRQVDISDVEDWWRRRLCPGTLRAMVFPDAEH